MGVFITRRIGTYRNRGAKRERKLIFLNPALISFFSKRHGLNVEGARRPGKGASATAAAKQRRVVEQRHMAKGGRPVRRR
jgi:hypothetical protein